MKKRGNAILYDCTVTSQYIVKITVKVVFV